MGRERPGPRRGGGGGLLPGRNSSISGEEIAKEHIMYLLIMLNSWFVAVVIL